MKEELITFETAKLAKKSGFDGLSYFYYMDNNPNKLEEVFNKRNPWDFNIKDEYRVPSKSITAPTQSLLQKWLRETKAIHLLVWFNTLTKRYRIESPNDELYRILEENFIREFDSYESALEGGLYEALKLIK